jgi:nitrogen fixation/metabolism regulation signal transduction histidine kinase
MYESKRELNPKEKNININYFVRELRNIFESGNKIEIPNEIICELVSLIFDKQMDDTQLNNILKNSNKNISNTSYTLQFTTKENNIEEREYIKPKIAYSFSCTMSRLSRPVFLWV